MKAFKFTPLRFIYILFSFLATTTAALAVAPVVISNFVSVELNQPFGPYQISTSEDGTPDAPILYNTQGLPAWLSCDPLTGEIIGDPGPTESGVVTVELYATNGDGTGTGVLTITVIDPITLPAITSPLAITADADASYTYTITASNSPTSFSVLGLSAMDTDAISPINPTTGIFSFTPSVSGVGDVINLLIGATNSQGTDNEILQVTISPSTAAPTSPVTVTIDPTLTGNQFDPQQASTIDVSANVIPATGSTIDSVTVYWNNPPAKPDGTPRNPIILTSLNGSALGGEFSGTINLGFDPENQELGGGNIDLEIRAYQTNAVDSSDYTSDSVNFRVGPLLEVIFPDDNLERGPFSLGDIFASARISTNQFSQITARISGPGIVNEVVDSNNLNNPNGVFNFEVQQAIDFGGPYDVTVTVEDSFQATTEETKRFFIRNNSGQPSATIISPTPGFTNVVFTPALFTFDQQGVRRLTRDDDGNITRTEITYLITGVTQGQGYYPPDASGRNMDYNFLGDDSGTANVSGNVTKNGRLENISRELTISSDSDWSGYGSSGTGFVDDSDDPGLYSRFNIAADFSSGGVQLDSFKIFVNGAEILEGNLNPNNGPLDPPIVPYPASGEGHLLPGIYVVEAQLFDADGKVASANPLTFEILPYEPLQITLQRYLASGASPSDPVLLNNPYSLLADVDPINEVGLVEFFESGSDTKLGEGSRVEIDGKGYYQFTHAFESPGNFEVYAQVTAIDERTAISAPVDITVITSAIPEVEITSPADGNRINPGETLEISIEASDADTDGFITSVEVFNNFVSLGFANLVSLDNAVAPALATYRFDYPTTAADIGNLNLEARATDNQGNIGFSDLVQVSLIQSAIPTATITSPSASGLSIKSGETLKVTVIAADTAPGFITSVEVFDNDVSLGLANPTGVSNEYSLSIPTSVANLGTLNLQARAVDNQGNVAYSAVIDHSVVQGVVPTVSIDDPLNGEAFNINTPIPIAITADHGDPQNSILTVEVFDAGGSGGGSGGGSDGVSSLGFASSLGGNQYEFTLTDTETAGLKRLTAVATDELGNSSTSDEVNVILTSGISPVTVIDTINGAVPAVAPAVDVVDRGSIVTLEISASDNDGNVSQVEVFNGANSIGFASLVGVDTYHFDYQASSPGLLNLQVRATDDLGNIGFSDQATVSVITGAIPTVTIDSPGVVSIFNYGDVIPFEITASDSDGSISSVSVLDLNNGTPTALGPALKVDSVGNDQYRYSLNTALLTTAGTKFISVRAVDDRGNVSTDVVEIRLDVVPFSVNFVTQTVTNTATNTTTTPTASPYVIEGAIGEYTSASRPFTVEIGGIDPSTLKSLDWQLQLDDGSAPVSVSETLAATAAVDGQAVVEATSLTFTQSFEFSSAGTLTVTATNTSDIVVQNSLTVFIDLPEPDEDLTDFINYIYNKVQGAVPSAMSVDALIVGEQYEIVTVGTTDFATLGPVPINENSLIPGQTYQIVTEGTDFTTAGAPSNAVGTVFTAGPIASTGSTGTAIDISVGTVFTSNGTAGSGTGTVRSEVIAATNTIGVDTAANRAAWAATLFPSDQYNDSRYQTVALVYKTVTGQWPTQAQLESGLDIISQDTTVQSSQTVSTQEGSITAGGTQTLSFNYSAGDQVTITATGDGTNANPLTDATLTIRAPDGSFVGYSDDNFLSGNFSLDPVVSFVASQTGAHTATVGGYFSSLSGDFVVTSASTAIESNTNTLAARALVESLKGVYNGADGFLANTATASSSAAAFVAQIYQNKHELGIMTYNSAFLGGRLTGVDTVQSTGDIIPGYQSNVVNFVADFALDVDLTTGSYASLTSGDGYPYSKIIYYGRPSNPLLSWDQARAEIQSDANLNSALSALLGIQNPTASDLAPYAGITFEEALALIFASAEFDAQFAGDTANSDTDGDGFSNYEEVLLGTDPDDGSVAPSAVDLQVALYMLSLGVDDGDKVALDDDADADGVSNYVEFLLDTDPSDGSVAPTAANSFVAQRMVDLGVVDPTMIEANDDADGDGVSNYAEILLNTDPSDIFVAPTAADSLVAQTMIDLGVVDPNMVAANDDADGDGVSNYAEILLNTGPSDGSVAPTAVDSFVTQRMIDLGVVDGDKVAAEDDADGDGVSNIAEILFNANPSNINDEPTASGTSYIDATDFVFEFVRLKSSLTPIGASVVVECADESFTFVPISAVDLQTNLSLSADQTGITSDYERVEYRVDTSSIGCSFFRLSAQ